MTGKLILSTSTKIGLAKQLFNIQDELNEKGKLKPEFLKNSRNKINLIEVLKFLDKDAPDDLVFEALRKVFVASVYIDSKEKEELLAHNFIRIIKTLESPEILVLQQCYKVKLTWQEDYYLYSLEGALEDKHWNDIGEKRKKKLLKEVGK